MAPINPTIDPPRLASAVPHSVHSRSPSRSPVRQQDPFLRDLSPTKTLRAFASRPTESNNDALTKSIQDATHSQRALGTKVAQACTDLRSWTRELENWRWPGTFDSPEPARKKQRMSAMTLLSRTESMISQTASHDPERDDQEDEYWGSLPAQLVQSYEKRLEEICVDFDTINFSELKTFVLSAHSQAGVREASIDDSIGAIGAATDLKRLDDFTALITATILQALPYLPKLTGLLETWTTRLSILRSSPRYLRDLKKARTDLDHGWAALAVSTTSQSRANADLTAEGLEDMKSVISTQVYSLGKRLDRFLDMLEGRREVVPDSWIDDFEELEGEYGEWVVKAERKVFEGEWKSMKEQVKETALKTAREDEEDEVKDMEDVPNFDNAENGEVKDMEDVPNFGDEEVERDAGISLPNDSSPGILEVAPWTESANGSNKPLIREPTSSSAASIGVPRVLREAPSISPSRKQHVSPTRSRHVPIVIDYTHPDQPSSTSMDTSRSASVDIIASVPAATQAIPLTRAKSKTPSESAAAPVNVRQRAAFLNGDIEKSESLLKSKSAPIVRPFEHASNAFTRLFKRESSVPADVEDVRKKHVKTVDEGSKRSVGHETSSQDSGVPSSASGSGKASSLISGSGSSKQKIPHHMEYMDMARAPSEPRPKSGDKKRGRDRTSSRDKSARVAYGDLVMATPLPRPRSKGTNTARKSDDTKSSRAVTVESDGRTRSLEGKKLNPVTPWDDVVPPSEAAVDLGSVKSNELIGVITGHRPLDETARSIPSSSKKKSESREIIALPARTSEEAASSMKVTSPGPAMYQPDVQSAPSKQRSVPATYRPSGLSERAQALPEREEDDFPPDWPLSTSATPMESTVQQIEYFSCRLPPGHETTTPDEPVQSDDFEQFFVRSLPAREGLQQAISSSVIAQRNFGNQKVVVRSNSAPGFRTRSTGDRSMLRNTGNGRSRRFDFMGRPVTVVEEETLSDDEDARRGFMGNAAGYVGNQVLKRSKSTPHVSPKLTQLSISEADADAVVTPDEQEHVIIKRASVASIEAHSPAEVKSIEIGRRSFEIPEEPDSAPQTPKAREFAEAGPSSPPSHKGIVVFPSPPPSVPDRGSSLRGSISSVKSDSPAAVKQPASTSPPLTKDGENDSPLNTVMSKQRKPKRNSRGSVGESVGSPEKKRSTVNHQGEDNFDRQVSEVLDRVHAPIRFKARPGSITPVATKTAVEQRVRAKAERQGKNMTLAPAEPSPNKASSADPEVKLYHLTQVGRAEPIKLYVRLVGDNERVMVRVGGGWADLADYLRQYAEHHGSRTVSESVLELQTASTPGSANGSIGSGKRAVSGPTFAPEPKSRTPITPTVGKYTTSPAAKPDLWNVVGSNSRPRLWLGDDSDDDGEQSPTLGRDQQVKITSAGDSASPPSTADASARPTSSQGALDASSPVGLDGKAKTELPEQKARWVEGMIEKAMKSASAASVSTDRENQKAFGDMGKVGGTRRVVFRSAAGAESTN